MTNPGRSRRCFRCRQRKVKCGEQRPACDTCIARGETCPGYSPVYEFRSENDLQGSQLPPESHLTQSAAKQRRRQRGLVLVHYAGSSKTFARPPHEGAKKALKHESLGSGLLSMPSDSIGTLRSVYCHLISQALPPKIRLEIYGFGFFDQLPSHLGVSDALDNAVECLCVWHKNRVGIEKDEVKLLRAQARTLSCLRTVLESPTLSRTNETLASVIILACIQAVSTSHRDGISALLKHRGPPKRDEPDAEYYKTLIVSAQGLAWSRAMETRMPCFLDDPEWQATIVDALDASKPLGQKYSIARVASGLIARIPVLLSDTHQLLAQPKPHLDATADLARRIHDWRADALRPDEALRDVQASTLAALDAYKITGKLERCRHNGQEPRSALDNVPSSDDLGAFAAYTELCAYTAGLCAMLAASRRALVVLDAHAYGKGHLRGTVSNHTSEESCNSAREFEDASENVANRYMTSDSGPDRGHVLNGKDAATELPAEIEVKVLQNRAAEAYEPLLEANVRSLPYLNAAFRSIFDAANALDGAETWQDIITARRTKST